MSLCIRQYVNSDRFRTSYFWKHSINEVFQAAGGWEKEVECTRPRQQIYVTNSKLPSCEQTALLVSRRSTPYFFDPNRRPKRFTSSFQIIVSLANLSILLQPMLSSILCRSTFQMTCILFSSFLFHSVFVSQLN